MQGLYRVLLLFSLLRLHVLEISSNPPPSLTRHLPAVLSHGLTRTFYQGGGRKSNGIRAEQKTLTDLRKMTRFLCMSESSWNHTTTNYQQERVVGSPVSSTSLHLDSDEGKRKSLESGLKLRATGPDVWMMTHGWKKPSGGGGGGFTEINSGDDNKVRHVTQLNRRSEIVLSEGSLQPTQTSIPSDWLPPSPW